MKIPLPHISQVSQEPLLDTIHAIPGCPVEGTQEPVVSQFSTVLIHECNADIASMNLLDSEYSNPALISHSKIHAAQLILGLQVARVHAIFHLPSQYTEFSEHLLAFVEWFTLFQHHDENVRMFIVSHSTHSHQCCTSIIPITAIECSCHLIPVWGKKADCR